MQRFHKVKMFIHLFKLKKYTCPSSSHSPDKPVYKIQEHGLDEELIMGNFMEKKRLRQCFVLFRLNGCLAVVLGHKDDHNISR